MKKSGWLGFVLAIIAIALLANSLYTVRQDQQVLLLEFGAPIGTKNSDSASEDINEAGLHFKMPWHTVEYLDKRNLGYTFTLSDAVRTEEQRELKVDAFVRWRISDPLKYYQSLRTERAAIEQLRSYAEDALRSALGRLKVPEIVSGQRSQLMDEIREKVNDDMKAVGVVIIDVRILQADLPDSIATSVYNRMSSARLQEAQRIRSEGVERAQKINAQAQKERTVIEAQAREKAEIIRGEGDAERNRIYADAYTKDVEFFSFQRGLIACEKAITNGTRLVIDPKDIGVCDPFIEAARRASR